MLENSPAGLVMLGAEVTVTVTREEHHQPALARYAVAPGMQRQVAVELAWCTITSGKYEGQRAIEVRLDGARVGELTHLMSHRYAPLVAQVAARGARPGCEALIQQGPRGLEVLLRLPRNGNTVIPLPTPAHLPPAPVGVPRRTSSQAPKWIAAAVVGLIFVAALVGSRDDAPEPAAQLSSTTYSPPTTTTTSSSATTTTTTTTTTTVVPAPQPQQPVAPKPQTPKPQPPAPQPPAPAPPVQNDCNPNYSGCVPNASDVDCAGGSGNGPAYVSGPIRVIGTDVYGLDNDKDGVACE